MMWGKCGQTSCVLPPQAAEPSGREDMGTLNPAEIEEGEETQLRGTENILNKIIEENFLNLKKDMGLKV